jgi:hypothetical protein
MTALTIIAVTLLILIGGAYFYRASYDDDL